MTVHRDRHLGIRLPNGRTVTVAAYVRAWRQLRALPPTSLVTGFDDGPTTAAAVLESFSSGLNERINRHRPYYGRGRKWGADEQRAMVYTAALLRSSPRCVLDWVPASFRSRLAHRLRARCRADAAAASNRRVIDER